MLKPEDAKAEIQKRQNKDWFVPRLKAADALPEQMRAVARSVLGVDDESDNSRPGRVGGFKRLAEFLLTQDESGRRQLFETLAPGLSLNIERGWQLLDKLPFQSTGDRKPFRVPGSPKALIGRRVKWLLSVLRAVGPYEEKLPWFAAWAPHLMPWATGDALGILFAAAIDAGDAEGNEVFQILCASGRNEHEIGGMGRHVIRALLSAGREDGWELIEKMLLAAQREEGLRQTILESVDEAHPQAFRRMLRLILDKDLARFSATVRAFDVWLGYRWDAVSSGAVNKVIEKLLLYLDDEAARIDAIKGADAEQAYLALWCIAFSHAAKAVPPAAELLKHPKAEHRYVAAHLLGQLGLVSAQQHLLATLEDEDLRIAHCAVTRFARLMDAKVIEADLFERLEKLLPRYSEKPVKLAALVWPWTAATVSSEFVAALFPAALGKRQPTRLIPYLPKMNPQSRLGVVSVLAKQETWDAPTRDTLLSLVTDASQSIRGAALVHLAKCQLTPAEAANLEPALERKAGDLRRGILNLLLRQPDADTLASADRLVASSSQPRRLAGLELLRELVVSKRSVAESRARAERYAAAHPKLQDAEQQQIKATLAAEIDVPVLANALGLLRHEDRTWPPPPQSRDVKLHSPAAQKIIVALSELFDANADREVTVITHAGAESKSLLSQWRYAIANCLSSKPVAEARAEMPLAGVWEEWWTRRGPEFRDADGVELLRALARCHGLNSRKVLRLGDLNVYPEAAKKILGVLPEENEKVEITSMGILMWLLRVFPVENAVPFALDAAESALALIPAELLQRTKVNVTEDGQRVEGAAMQALQALGRRRLIVDENSMDWRSDTAIFNSWLRVVADCSQFLPSQWSEESRKRHWLLLRWVDEPRRPLSSGGAVKDELCLRRHRPDLKDVCLGHPTDADVLDQLLGGSRESTYWGGYNFADLKKLTRRTPAAEYSSFKFLTPLVEKCRARILEIELTRGDNPTAASPAALSLGSIWGVADLTAVLRALGKRNFVRGWARDSESMETVFSHLIRRSFPLPNETVADFKKAVKEAAIGEDRLVELAVYAPQWASFVEYTLGWKSLVEAVWWIHAHTKGDDWRVDKDIRDLWEADMNARTTLSPSDLLEGGVDVAWFHRIHQDLGAKRWDALCAAAKFASTGSGHTRAMLFSDAMLGKTSKKDLVLRIEQKRHQDAVRSLGLLPLASGKKRDADVLDRYKVLQEFRRGSKQFGSMRQASEKRAAQIGQQNLARTAGFDDPIRLEWAMEAKAIEDLADGPIVVEADGVKLSLGIDPWGEIELTVSKGGKSLSDIPAGLKKNPKVAALRARKVELKRQASRIRPSLEQFMVRGDELTGVELLDLMKHPLLAPMLKNLVLIGEGISGFPIHDGKALENHSGEIEAIKASEKLRIAHPCDLLPASEWHKWQKDCFARERIQPFKQIFREYYPLTATEKNEGNQTRRYAGHQVQPRQALALLGQRGWVHHPEEGVRKIFHHAGLVAWLQFDEGFFTPAEIEGLTLESVFFTKRDDSQPIKLEQIPTRLFSEAMRDLDLVVSVAHRGGVDPEATASTMEMRATLVSETARLLQLKGVEVKGNYAFIKGKLAEYSVHLGSAVTRKKPGDALFIFAVHSQHRGRFFLPFADDDPRTAEVVSKVLLLARDCEIKDPSILAQIRSV